MAKVLSDKDIVLSIADAGVELTPVVKAAIEADELEVRYPTAETVMTAIASAKTQDELDRAVKDAALGRVVADFARQPEFSAAVRSIRSKAFRREVTPWVQDSIQGLCEVFNGRVAPFVAAVDGLPDVQASNPMDVDLGVLQQLHEAKQAAQPLKKAWIAYNRALRFLGGGDEHGRTAPSASVIVARLGRIDDQDAYVQAVTEIQRWAHGAHPMAHLFPMLPIVRAGGQLELVDPATAESRLIDVQDERPRAAF